MTLSKKTRLGTVTVNNNVIAKVILRAAEKTEGKLFLSSERGRILGVASRIGVGDISGNFEIEEKEAQEVFHFRHFHPCHQERKKRKKRFIRLTIK